MTTATKTKRKPVDEQWSIEDEIARELDRKVIRLAAFEHLKSKIVREVEDIESATLHMSTLQFAIFAEFGPTTNREIVQALAHQSQIEQAREEVGDPAKIDAAKAELDAAIDAEQNARAEAGDLDGDTAGEPVLAKQIRSLQKRLTELGNARNDAQLKYDAMVAKRKWLREAAVPSLRDEAARQLALAKRGDPNWRKLEDARLEIRTIGDLVIRTKFVNQANWHNDLILATHAQHRLPEAFNHGGGTPSIDVEKFKRYLAELQQETVPALEKEVVRLEAEWKKLTDHIDASLDHWMKTGEMSC